MLDYLLADALYLLLISIYLSGFFSRQYLFRYINNNSIIWVYLFQDNVAYFSFPFNFELFYRMDPVFGAKEGKIIFRSWKHSWYYTKTLMKSTCPVGHASSSIT